MNTLVARVSEGRQRIKIIPSLAAADVIVEVPKGGSKEHWLELRTDQGHGATCGLASIDERSKYIASIDTPRIFELLQLR